MLLALIKFALNTSLFHIISDTAFVLSDLLLFYFYCCGVMINSWYVRQFAFVVAKVYTYVTSYTLVQIARTIVS